MFLVRSNSNHAGQPRQRTQALTVDNPLLYSVTKLLFPLMPRVVRARKMRILCVATLLVLGLCASLAVALWLLERFPHA